MEEPSKDDYSVYKGCLLFTVAMIFISLVFGIIPVLERISKQLEKIGEVFGK